MHPPTIPYRANNPFMQSAIDEARKGIYQNDGGPFGSVVVKHDSIIGKGHNCVLSSHDSTCHGEIAAIRAAEKALASHDLTGCELYTTGEPCPMCLAACLWAHIDKVYYGCTLADNASIGFKDELFNELMGGRESIVARGYLEELDRTACLELFEEYRSLDRERY